MKILIPNYSLSDSFVENVSVTLESMGHEVTNMGKISVRKAYSTFNRLFKEGYSRFISNQSDQEKFILKTIKTQKYDVLLSLTQSLDEDVLSECRKKGIRTISWWGDTAANMNKRGLCTPEWDFIFIKDQFAANKLTSLGLNAEQLNEAMNPIWHIPNFEQKNEEIIIAGSFYDYRQLITKRLIENDIKVGLFGPPLPIWSYPEIKKLHKNEYITKERKSQIFGEGLAVLNSTAMREFDSMNCRAFEIAGCGGLQIMENRSAISACFEPGKEILVYDNFNELMEKINWAKSSPKEAKLIRLAAYKRVMAEHTYTHRINHILSKI